MISNNKIQEAIFALRTVIMEETGEECGLKAIGLSYEVYNEYMTNEASKVCMTPYNMFKPEFCGIYIEPRGNK